MSRPIPRWAAACSALVAAAGVALLVVRLAAGSDGGGIRVSGAYVPQPATPTVAAAYFTVRNSGAAPDTLQSVSSDAGSDTMLMQTTDGAMSMSGPVAVPAHGELRLAPGGYHVMFTPDRTLARGDTVRLTLTFASAGEVTVDAPVVSMTYRPADD